MRGFTPPRRLNAETGRGLRGRRSERKRDSKPRMPRLHPVPTLETRRPQTFRSAAFINPGSYLLSRDLSSDYHRRADVSLPGSEWDRVGPSGYDHQASGSFSLAACLVVIAAWVLLFCCSAVFRLTGMLTSAWHGVVLNRV